MTSRSGYLSFSIKVTDDGDGRVLLYACESDTRRKGEVLFLTVEEFSEVSGLVQKVSQSLAQLRASKQMRGRCWSSYPLRSHGPAMMNPGARRGAIPLHHQALSFRMIFAADSVGSFISRGGSLIGW